MPTTAPTSPSAANSVSEPGNNYIPGWEGAVLGLIGAPNTAANRDWLATWHSYEQSSAQNNPLNVTAYPPDPITVGLGGINSAGVQSYSSPAQGLQATATFLKMPNYAPILAALKSGDAYGYSKSHSSDVAKSLSIWGTRNNFVYIATSGSPQFGSQAGAGTGGIPDIGSAEKAVGSAASSVGSAATSTADFLGKLSNPMLWLRVAEVMGGALLIGLALYLIAKDMGLAPGRPSGAAGKALDAGEDSVRSLELQTRAEGLQARREASTQRAATQASVDRARIREARAKARAAESGAHEARRRAERARGITSSEIANLQMGR